MISLIHLFCIINFSILGQCYNLLDRYYPSNNIDIHISQCPSNIDCVSMIFKANNILQVPGTYMNINWYFNEVDTANVLYNGKNDIIFKNMENQYGKTEFQLHDGKILEFNMIINPYGISETILYNIILHELGHVYLLAHSEFKDSVMGYKLDILPSGIIQSTDELIELTRDDCNGLYKRLIRDIYKNNDYVVFLYRMKSIFCTTLQENYILEDPNKIIKSVIVSPNDNRALRQNKLNINRQKNNFSPDKSALNKIRKISKSSRGFIRG